MAVDPQQLADGVLKGERRALARAITLVESTRADHRAQASEILERLAPHAGGAMRIGITGVPGAGKSTFIEAFGTHLIDQGKKVAVLAVDPSSGISGGSILGDKTRMEELSRRREAFIRPSPSGTTLGGVARRTRETLLLCEAAGFDVVLVETVGVGQSETAVSEMTDLFLLLLLPSGGDDLQGIKRGIMELADIILVNKADGDLKAAAERSAGDYRRALTLLHPRSSHWKVPVESMSALTHTGIELAWQRMQEYWQCLSQHGEIDSRRAEQARAWMWSETADNLLQALKDHPEVQDRLHKLEGAVMAGHLPPTLASRELLELFLKS